MRRQFQFWLDDTYGTDSGAVTTMIDVLKANRLFTQTVRDGIRLVVSLRAGRIDVLEALFPEVYSAFRQSVLEKELKYLVENGYAVRVAPQREATPVQPLQFEITKTKTPAGSVSENFMKSMGVLWQ